MEQNILRSVDDCYMHGQKNRKNPVWLLAHSRIKVQVLLALDGIMDRNSMSENAWTLPGCVEANFALYASGTFL